MNVCALLESQAMALRRAVAIDARSEESDCGVACAEPDKSDDLKESPKPVEVYLLTGMLFVEPVV